MDVARRNAAVAPLRSPGGEAEKSKIAATVAEGMNDDETAEKGGGVSPN
jgi:hypothetical protein